MNKEVHQLHETWHPERFKSYNRADTVTFFKQMMATSVMTFFLAVQAGKPLGYLWFEQRAYHENSFKQSFASLYVHQICVKEGVKQQGVGKMLMQEVEQLAIRDGIDRIELDVWVKNESARAFYEALGYEPIRQVMSKTMNN
nr:GNAT family N-acetyltransferase [Salsuginibacillus kocurii]